MAYFSMVTRARAVHSVGGGGDGRGRLSIGRGGSNDGCCGDVEEMGAVATAIIQTAWRRCLAVVVTAMCGWWRERRRKGGYESMWGSD
jgi:hypothetical protein